MAHQNLFEALQRIAGFTALESDMFEIIDAVDKDRAEMNKSIEMEKKQTAVDWLIEQMKKPYADKHIMDILNQAKALEKQQIVAAHFTGQPFSATMLHNAEQYYTQTYGKD